MLKIIKVQKNSLAKDYGFEVGDEIVAFDSFPAEDELDYLFYTAKPKFSVTVKSVRGGEQTVEIEKDEDEDFGLSFEKDSKIRTCHNHCVFCFVDQMPKGLRESLYVKDDDYGMSFTCGNFVTLTNLSDEGLERIVRLHLSPLYVSVHTMNGELRSKLLNNRFAGRIGEQIERLVKGGIKIHCQAVIVPNVNDGEELKYTARELFKYYPNVCDLAVVPTGLTKYRETLTKIPDIDGEYSKKFLSVVEELNKEFKVNFVLPADEYFVRAGAPFKDVGFYGDFEQIENGIGMTTKFCFEAFVALKTLDNVRLKKPKKTLVVSGVSADKINAEILKKANAQIEGLHAEVLTVKNSFFGETVTCTGLLTGQDILDALLSYRESKGDFDEVVLPSNTLKEFEDVFLCGMTLDELKKKSNCKNIRVNHGGGEGLIAILSAKK